MSSDLIGRSSDGIGMFCNIIYFDLTIPISFFG